MNRTRIVRWLRVVLPLLALALLSTMFLFSRQPGTAPQIPYTEVDAEQMARDPRVIAPNFAAVTGDGAELSLTAREAAPAGGAQDGSASDLHLDWRRPDGLRAELTAPDAAVTDEAIALRGGVQMATSSGWTLHSAQIEAATDRSRLTARDGVTATAPFGDLSAGEMELTPREAAPSADDAGGAAVFRFSGGVRLIYQP